MDWTTDPATEQQLNLLRKLGFVPARPLSVTEAASLIRQYKRHPPLPVASHAVTPPARPVEAPSFQSSHSQAQTAQTSADPIGQHRFFPLRQPSQPAGGLAPPAVDRAEFWIDTCREPRQMQIASARVYEFRQKYGRQFRPPNREQAQEILQALDSVMPAWERENPELFYRTLELNFPELTRQPTTP